MGLKPATNPDVEAVTIELSIDGKSVTAKSGVSLYDVISSTGKIIPAMCYHYTFDPFGSCGMCLVTQEGKKAPVRSCTAKAAAGMIIKTEGDDLFQARKKAVEKHLSVHPLDCPSATPTAIANCKTWRSGMGSRTWPTQNRNLFRKIRAARCSTSI